MEVKLNSRYQTLTGAKVRGHEIPTYDDGWENLYIHRDSTGITGIVCARDREEAYEICEDEFFPSADEEAHAELDALTPDGDDMTEEQQHRRDCWNEAYGFRPNGVGGPTPKEDHGIYARDLNGDSLDTLTEEMLDQWDITLDVKTDWDGIREIEELKKCHGITDDNIATEIFGG